MHHPPRKLIVYTSLVFLCTGLVLAFLFIMEGRNVRRDVSQNMIRGAADAVTKRFREVITPVERDLRLIRSWGRSGLLDLSDSKALDDKCLPLLESQPILSGLVLADTTGREYSLLRRSGVLETRSAGPYRSDGEVVVQRRDNLGRPLESAREPRDYDPRTRIWFTGAIESKDPEAISWTKPYQFVITKKVGLSASVRWQSGDDNGPTDVASFDILLDDLHRFVSELKVTPKAQVLLLRGDGYVLTDSVSTDKDDDMVFTPTEELTDPVVRDALLLWQKQQNGRIEALKYKSRGQAWWAGFQPLKPEVSNAWIAVIIPEADLVGDLWTKWINLAVIAILILAVGAALILYGIRRYGSAKSPDIREIVPADFQQAIDSLTAAGESGWVEFKSTVRTNLKTGQVDKAIEIAWLKTVTAFLNSDGGTLLIGVDDDGCLVGVEPDGFENHDRLGQHIKNLINQHIGPEFSPQIKCEVQDVDDKTVVMLSCEPSRTPVFLTMGKKEDFYIRSGPSSVRLSMSRMVKYLDQRK